MYDACFSYGVGHGCDENCPVLLEGNCQITEENLEHFDISDEEKREILIYLNAKKLIKL